MSTSDFFRGSPHPLLAAGTTPWVSKRCVRYVEKKFKCFQMKSMFLSENIKQFPLESV